MVVDPLNSSKNFRKENLKRIAIRDKKGNKLSKANDLLTKEFRTLNKKKFYHKF